MNRIHSTVRPDFETAFASFKTTRELLALGYLKSWLRRSSLLEVRSDGRGTSGLLLEWLRPRRLVVVQTEDSDTIVEKDGIFDAAFVFLPPRGDAHKLGLSELRRVLVPGGLLVFCQTRGLYVTPGGADPWKPLRRTVTRSGFEIIDEQVDAPCVLVASATNSRAAAVQMDQCSRATASKSNPPLPTVGVGS